jgi:putative redox protein
MIKIELERVKGDYGFEARDANGHTVKIDNSPDSGGTNFGVRPMQLLLMGLGGCSGLDIISILKKQRQTVNRFTMNIEGEREKGKEPSLWESVTIVFELEGDIDPDKAYRACQLSIDKYCSVAETLRKAGGELRWKVTVNGQ